jgi:hypothetical protein
MCSSSYKPNLLQNEAFLGMVCMPIIPVLRSLRQNSMGFKVRPRLEKVKIVINKYECHVTMVM